MKKKGLIIISVIIAALVYIGVYLYSNRKKSNCSLAKYEKPIQPSFEIEPRFLISNSNDIFYSGHGSGNYSLYTYNDSGRSLSISGNSDIFFPFLIENKLCGLLDHNGNEEFTSTSEKLNKIIDHKSIKTVFSFKNGNLIFVKLNSDKKLYLVYPDVNVKKVVLDNIELLENVLYIEEHNCVLVSYDNKLVLINIKNPERQSLILIDKSDSQYDSKFNPFIIGDDLYFASNSNSEFYEIYKINLQDPAHKKSLIYKSQNDVRLPKFKNNNLYFIEIVNGEYLLKRYNLKTKTLTSITSHGVVYFYEFYKNSSIVYSFSDFKTGKCLILYNETKSSEQNLTGRPLPLFLTIKAVKPQSDMSPAYVLKTSLKRQMRGVILFFHPGLHSDFSPRWESVLMNLANRGYILIAPNYPMSCGFGKMFYDENMENSLKDIFKWKTYIKLKYPTLKLYYLSSSSGNILMEKALSENDKNVSASSSLFGVPAFDNPDPTIPSLYILGKNDPVVNFASRLESLNIARKNNDNISFHFYSDEGHWLRKEKNIENCIAAITDEFCENN